MTTRSRGTVILIALVAMTAFAMLLPAAIGFTLREHRAARAFLYSAILLGSFAGLVYLANRSRAGRTGAFSHPFFVLTAAYIALPLIMAIPLTEAVPGLTLFRAWFEMTASFTTTGASLLGDGVPVSVHVWRALVAWAGGAFVLVYALAILAPLNLGGFEVLTTSAPTTRDGPKLSDAHLGARADLQSRDDVLARLGHNLRLVTPLYAGLTLLLWVGLSVTGIPPLRALVLAMSTLSTSGIVIPGADGLPASVVAEAMIALVLVTALSRAVWLGLGARGAGRRDWWRTEIRMGIALLACVAALYALHVAFGTVTHGAAARLAELWAVLFTSLSFLTTTGFHSHLSPAADGFLSGTGGVVLFCLAVIGGGIATTAGGVKLMRVFALLWQGRHEMGQLIYPSSIGGDGPAHRALRTDGAFAAWLYVMVFMFSLTCAVAVLTLFGQTLESALQFALAALTTTGPLAQVGPFNLVGWSGLGMAEQALLAFAMVLGRLDFLLLLSVLWPRR
jgi:trk system potassium uptake protein TrkH